VFHVRYELDSYILFRRNAVFRGLIVCNSCCLIAQNYNHWDQATVYSLCIENSDRLFEMPGIEPNITWKQDRSVLIGSCII
jgi:hypothetical protein